MIGHGIYPNKPFTLNAFRVQRCSNDYNKKHNINVKCADQLTYLKEIENLIIIPSELTFTWD